MRRPARPVVVGALIILAALGFLVYQGISNNVVYFIYPHDLLAKGSAADGQSFRLGGQVKPGTRQWDASTQTLRFVLQDTKDAVQVVSRGVPPEMFREGIGVVVPSYRLMPGAPHPAQIDDAVAAVECPSRAALV